jgi:ArsR family transcriptional regulator, virulence genes transcriptional regulator
VQGELQAQSCQYGALRPCAYFVHCREHQCLPCERLTPYQDLHNFAIMKSNELAKAADQAAHFLRAMAHPARLRMVCALLEGDRRAGELALEAGLRAPALSQQAAVLEAEGLISRQRDAQSVLYRLEAPEAKALAKFLHDTFCRPAQRSRRRTGRPSTEHTA